MTREQKAEQIRIMIERRDLTLSWVARRLGTSRQYVTQALSDPYAELSESLIERIETILYDFPEVKR